MVHGHQAENHCARALTKIAALFADQLISRWSYYILVWSTCPQTQTTLKERRPEVKRC